jgi:propionyl-CoA synthetase
VGGETNLCYNAVDRHLPTRSKQAALVWISTEVDAKREFTYAELHEEVNRCAAMLKSLGVGKGDRVLIYMPMTPEAVFCPDGIKTAAGKTGNSARAENRGH